jgi:putative membrane protein
MVLDTRKYVQAIVWIAIYLAVMIWSGWNPADRFTWWMEVFPTLIGVVVMALVWKRFPLTPILTWIILVHSILLFYGGHFTYSLAPCPNLFGDLFGHGRNNLDKVGHFLQGVTPAMVARELYSRTSPLKPGKWLDFLTICTALAFSAFYELIEFAVSISTGSRGDAFLGTQGYVWDTQTDMLMALIGSTLAMLTLSGVQDSQMRRKGWLK